MRLIDEYRLALIGFFPLFFTYLLHNKELMLLVIILIGVCLCAGITMRISKDILPRFVVLFLSNSVLSLAGFLMIKEEISGTSFLLVFLVSLMSTLLVLFWSDQRRLD